MKEVSPAQERFSFINISTSSLRMEMLIETISFLFTGLVNRHKSDSVHDVKTHTHTHHYDYYRQAEKENQFNYLKYQLT